MSRRRRGLLPALLLVAALVLSACGGLEGTGDLEYVPGEGNILQVGDADRGDPVAVSGTSLQGDPVDFADFLGRVVVVNVWWSGCGPCRREMPMLVQASEELPADEVAFVGINIRDSDENGIAFERERGVEYPSISDRGSETLLRFGDLAPSAMPSTAVLDREGRVAALISGEIPSKITLVDIVEEVAGEDG